MKCYLIFDASHVLLYCLSFSSSRQVLFPVFFALGVRNRKTSSVFVLKTLLRYYWYSSMQILIIVSCDSLLIYFNIIYTFRMFKNQIQFLKSNESYSNKYIDRNQINGYLNAFYDCILY